MELLELGAGVHSQLVAERPPQDAEPLQCLGLPPVAVTSQQ